MKSILLLLSVLSFSVSAKGTISKKEYLECIDGYERIIVNLDSGYFSPRSGYKVATGASIVYMYSHVREMTCKGFVTNHSYDINCVGYYGQGEITELKARGVKGDIFVLWKTSDGYGHENKETKCILKSQ